MKLHYTEIKPSPSLSDYVESYWHIGFDGPLGSVSSPNICIPKGTVEFVVTLKGNKAEVLIQNTWVPLDDVLVVGIQTSPIIWRIPGGTTKFGISLKPAAFLQLFGSPVADLHQKFVGIESLAGTRLNWFVTLLREAKDHQSRIMIVESLLNKKLATGKRVTNLLTEALNKIWKEEGNISTASLSKFLYIGERQLQRLFKNTMGVSPKLYSRLVRFRSAFEQAQSGKSPGWTDVAYNFGYTDQAHFVKDFKSFTGLTPTALFN